jgi:hypothetical protein
MSRRSDRRLVAVALTVALGAWACAGSSADEAGTNVAKLRVVATEDGAGSYAYEIPDRVPAGATRVSLTNDGTEVHHAQLFRLEDSASVADLAAALATSDPAAALAFGTFEGGTALVAPGKTSAADAVVDLEVGTYVLICFVEDAAGEAHLAHGMLQPFEVTGTNAPPSLPEADARVELVDYRFELPDSIPGDALLEVTNAADREPHEMEIARLDEGADAGDVLDALAAGQSPPATPLGGMQALLPGGSQLLRLDLAPGEYAVWCSIPSPFDQTPHHAKGMLQEVTIT